MVTIFTYICFFFCFLHIMCEDSHYTTVFSKNNLASKQNVLIFKKLGCWLKRPHWVFHKTLTHKHRCQLHNVAGLWKSHSTCFCEGHRDPSHCMIPQSAVHRFCSSRSHLRWSWHQGHTVAGRHIYMASYRTASSPPGPLFPAASVCYQHPAIHTKRE